MGKSAVLEPEDAADSIWMSLRALAARYGVEEPSKLMLFTRSDIWDVTAVEGGTAVATLPNRREPPLPRIGPHVVLEGSVTPGSLVRVLTYGDYKGDGPLFHTVDATVNSDSSALLVF